jgi:hypothetical protein
MRFGAGGILMRGVQDSRIEDNVFSHLENGEVEGTEYGPRLIHAVYLRDNSSGNTVRGNRFEHTSGDPVRVSNGSNDNRVVGNSTKNTGVQALVSHWYSTGDPNNVQAPSTGTVIKNNELGSLYGKSRKAKDIHHKVAKAVPTPVNV